MASAQATHDAYILGPGDGLQIELLDLSGRFSIGPDGTLYLPRLRALYNVDLAGQDAAARPPNGFKPAALPAGCGRSR